MKELHNVRANVESFHICSFDRENQGKIKVLSNAMQGGGYMI